METTKLEKQINTDEPRIRITDLVEEGEVELTDEELSGVTGGMCGSWASGACHRTDEWVTC